MKKTQKHSLIFFFFQIQNKDIWRKKKKKPMWDKIKEPINTHQIEQIKEKEKIRKYNDNKVRKPNINQIVNGNS